MVLDARHRSSIYIKLLPLLGEDDANALMSEYPSFEADELVTKQFVRAELAGLRTDLAELENRLTVRLGGAVATSTAVLGALVMLR